MPFISTKLLVIDTQPVNYDTDGQTIGQLVDQALAEMVRNMAAPSVPQSIEFGFDGEEDFHRFMSVYGPIYSETSSKSPRKSKRRDFDETIHAYEA